VSVSIGVPDPQLRRRQKSFKAALGGGVTGT